MTAVEASASQHERKDAGGWKQEGRDLLRAVAAGAIVGMPLLYTMEVWWHGMTLSEWHLLAILGATLLVNFLFSLASGFREEYSVPEALSEAFTAVGIGIVFAFCVLWLIGEVDLTLLSEETAGKVVVEAAAVSIGASFANSQVREKSRTGEENGGEAQGQDGQEGGRPSGAGAAAEKDPAPQDPERLQLKADLKDAGATLAGAAVFALNIAPTEEVIMIASRLTGWQQLTLFAASVLLFYVILFASGFEEHEVHVPGSVFQSPWAETAMGCALSLAVAFVLLFLLGQREIMSHPGNAVAATLTLGLPAVVGGAAGRLII